MGATMRGRTVGLAALTGILALAIVLLSSSLAFGAGGSPPGPTPEGGVLRLDLGWHNRFIYQAPDEPDQVQDITVHRCAASLAAQPDLVTLGAEPDGSSPSLAWAGLAVKQAAYDRSCKKVAGDEVLVFALSGGLSEKLIEYGELDIEAKHGTTVRFDMLLNGTVVDDQEFTASSSDASTYHSRRHDNYRVIVQPDDGSLYNQLRISVVGNSGWFRWEAGTDGTPKGPLGQAVGTKDSIFKLTDAQILGCGEDEGLETGGEGAPAATVFQPGGEGCTPIPVVFRSDADETEQSVELIKDESINADLNVTITWNPETPVNPVPATQIDFGQGPGDAVFCETPGEPAWCLRSQSAEVVAGQLFVVENYEGDSDPRWAR